jgi:Spy/CpxP family protein refolding chaperone
MSFTEFYTSNKPRLQRVLTVGIERAVNIMQRQFVKLATVAALATGLVFAQTPSPSPSPNTQTGRHQLVQRHRARMAQALNLTDAQKAQAKTIFQQARQSSKPIREQLKQNRQALATAIKADKSDAELQQLANQQGQLRGQMLTIRSEAAAKFYATLTPDQKAKADQMQQQFHQRVERFHSQRKNG